VEIEEEKAQINLSGSFSARDLDDIIRELAQVRASMRPPVSTDPPVGADDEILVQDDALFTVRTLTGGGLRFWLRNEGLGWLAFTLTAEKTRGLREFLSKKLGHTHIAH
jgi:hypothetical protein